MKIEKTNIEKIVRTLVYKQALKIVYKDLKKFNSYSIKYSVKKIINTSNDFYFPVSIYYKREKERLQKKFKRIKNNKNIISLKSKYNLIDVELLAYYLNITEILNFKTSKHYLVLEEIIKIVLGLSKNDDNVLKFKNYKYIKKIQSENMMVDVNYLAVYINSFTGFSYRSKEESELLENIIKIILSIPIAIESKTKLKQWQVKVKIDMECKHKSINEFIIKNRKELENRNR